MRILRPALTVFAAAFGCFVLAQKPMPAKPAVQPGSAEPLIADVHVAPYRAQIDFTTNFSKQRLDVRNATVVNMIDFILGRDDDDGREDPGIFGGPTWIDLDRFDVAAVLPAAQPASGSAGTSAHPASPYELAIPVMKRVLAERFHLTYHMADRPLPAFLATLAKDGPKLTEAKDAGAGASCHATQDDAAARKDAGPRTITCTSETIGEFLASFEGVYPHPVIDRTGLKKAYDFIFTPPSDDIQTRVGYMQALTDAFRRELGVVIAPGVAPQPALFVDAVERPTANPPDIAKRIPALPDLAFEVASIRPGNRNAPRSQIHPGGSQITFDNFSMQEYLVQAWQLPTGAMLSNVPLGLDQLRYTIHVTLPSEVDARAVYEDQEQIDNMLQKLLIERFGIKVHWGEQVQDGWVLLGGTPKMKKADPASRSYCKYGPPEGEKDVRTPESPYNAEFHCQNVSMAQFAELAQAMMRSEIKYHVLDKTDLAGSYDFTVYYTTARKLRTDAQAAARQAGDASSDPTGGISVEDAFRKQLGIRLVKQRNTYPALVLDHIEKTPTEN